MSMFNREWRMVRHASMMAWQYGADVCWLSSYEYSFVPRDA